MEFLVLGPLQILADGVPLPAPAATPQTLLGILLIHANQVVSVDRLLEEAWGDRQPTAGVKTLRYHVSKLRDVLEPNRGRGEEGVIATKPGGYVLRVGAGDVDAGRFRGLTEEGADLLADGRFEEARERLGEALDLWRGGAFEDFRYDSFAQGEIARLEEMRLLCVENRIGADLLLGRHREVVGELRELTTEYPMREGFWGQLMVALYRTDQQAEALAAYQAARKVLGEELGIEPNAALRRLEEQILFHELPFEAPEREAPPRDNLPARVSSFIGRLDEAITVEKLVDSHRLVTLTGFGGMGKTTLATEVARHLTGSYPDGVWLVELAALSEPNHLVGEIARVFDVPEHPTRPLLHVVVGKLSNKSMLMVIDSCEQLIVEAARVVTALLEGCPTLRVLATSREPLQVRGEQSWSVPPLELPDIEAETSVVAAGQIDAVKLFVERAQESQAAFELNEANVDEIVTICRRLDGIPLALELAAARLRMLSPRQLLERLDDRFAVLTEAGRTRPVRQQTLLATLGWSYDLLSDAEQTLLRRLAVFDGGFTLDAAEAVCEGDGINPAHVLDLTDRLVNTSLLTVSAEEPFRYGMLETVREYALALLARSGEETTLRRRHADYYGALFSGDPDWDTSEFGEMLEGVATEHENLRGALAWAFAAGEGRRALQVAASISDHWGFMAEEGLYWLPKVLELSESTPTLDRQRVLAGLGRRLAFSHSRHDSLSVLEELETAAEQLGHTRGAADALHIRSMYLDADGDIRGSRRLLMDHVGTLKDPLDATLPLYLVNIALYSILLGDFEHAVETIDEVEDVGERLGQRTVPALAGASRGMLAHYQGNLHSAHRLLVEALADMRRVDRVQPQSEPLRELAQVALASGEIEEAGSWAGQLADLGRRGTMSRPLVDGHRLAARVALRQGRIPAARQACVDAVDIAFVTSDIPALAASLAVAGQVAWVSDHAQISAVLHAGAEAVRERIGFVHPVHRARELDRELAHVHEALGAGAFDLAWELGATSSLDSLVDQARGSER